MDWGKVNQPTSPEVFDELYEKAIKYFNTKVGFDISLFEFLFPAETWCWSHDTCAIWIVRIKRMCLMDFAEQIQSRSVRSDSSTKWLGNSTSSPICSFGLTTRLISRALSQTSP